MCLLEDFRRPLLLNGFWERAFLGIRGYENKKPTQLPVRGRGKIGSEKYYALSVQTKKS